MPITEFDIQRWVVRDPQVVPWAQLRYSIMTQWAVLAAFVDSPQKEIPETERKRIRKRYCKMRNRYRALYRRCRPLGNPRIKRLANDIKDWFKGIRQLAPWVSQ